jgi:hypothetical protein
MVLHNFKRWKQLSQNKDGFISFLFGLALVTIIFLVCLIFQFLSFSTPTEIRQLKGRGTERIYDFPYDEVFETAGYLLNEKGFTIIESNKGEGYIIAADEQDFFYEGRLIAVFVTPESSEKRTRVDIVSKLMALPPLKELIFPKYRPSQMLKDISKYLEDSNGER